MTRVPLNIGHRGLPDGNPENTVEGSLLAYEAGADVIENDVYLTADGQVVVMHDGTTGRTCNRNLSVTGSTLAELKELYVNRGFENVEGKNNWRIPTLEEYLIAFRGKDCRLFIELKSDQKGLVEAVRDLVNRYDMYAQVAVITFHESQMRTMREVWPEMSVGALCGGYLDETDSDADIRGVMNFIGKYNATLNPSYSGYGENAIRAALIRGIGVYPWTFVGSSYNQYFTWGYSGLTGNTAGRRQRFCRGEPDADAHRRDLQARECRRDLQCRLRVPVRRGACQPPGRHPDLHRNRGCHLLCHLHQLPHQADAGYPADHLTRNG